VTRSRSVSKRRPSRHLKPRRPKPARSRRVGPSETQREQLQRPRGRRAARPRRVNVIREAPSEKGPPRGTIKQRRR
jgi:hypothetical protein